MRNNEYWTKRFEKLEDSMNKYGVESYRQIEGTLLKAQSDIQKEIEVWLYRISKNNEVSINEARKLLDKSELEEFKWDVQEFIKYGKENSFNSAWMKELENASAKYHISRLEALKIRSQQALERAFGNELDEVDNMAKKVYTESYYRTSYEIQRGLNIGWDIANINNNKLDKIISKPWASDGKDFSSRVWQSKTSMVNELHKELTRTCVLGKAPDEAIQHMSKYVNSKFKNARYQAGRLVMTEQAYFSSASQKDAYNDLGVEKYEIVATLDSHTSSICQDLDGEVFSMKDYQSGVTAPPFHVYCRSCTAPYFDDDFLPGKRAARDKDGKTYYVPDSMKYDEWKKKFVDGGSKEVLKPVKPSATIESKKEVIQDLIKLKNSGMAEDEYDEYLGIINKHDNTLVRQLYSKHGDEIRAVKKLSSGGQYSPSSNSIKFSYPKYDDMNKYGTLAHEYGHFFDAEIPFDGIHFKEIEAVRNATGLDVTFKKVASSSDEFLEAIRKDKEHIKKLFNPDIKKDLIAHNASSGVQDAIDGLFPKSRIRWGHGERYYNRKYADIEFTDKMVRTSRKKELQRVYKDLGFDVSNQAKVKIICRQYEAASEAWANIMSAEVCGGETLEYVKKYLPNSYRVMIKILKNGVK